MDFVEGPGQDFETLWARKKEKMPNPAISIVKMPESVRRKMLSAEPSKFRAFRIEEGALQAARTTNKNPIT